MNEILRIAAKWLIVGFFAMLGFQLAELSGHTQETRKPEPFTTKFTIALFSADATLRAIDGYSTVKLLNDPCRCFKESDPIAPKGGSIAAEAGFQAGALAAVYGGAWLLNRHGHHKLARTLLMVDIGSEGYAVGRNYTRERIVAPVGTSLQHLSLNNGGSK
jgi:hypothetical protein